MALSPDAFFTFQNVSYILAFVLLLVLVGRREKPDHSGNRSSSGRSDGSQEAPAGTAVPRGRSVDWWLRSAVLAICVVRFVVAYILIFTDVVGGGEMFTYQGVLDLFRSKGDAWVVGLWMELCTLFIVCGYWMLQDSASAGVARLPLAVSMLATFFVAGFGFALYLALRSRAWSKLRHKFCEDAV